jgi:hypothetical protein
MRLLWKPGPAIPAITRIPITARQAHRIAYTTEDVFKADIILKVAPPSSKELELMKTSANADFLFCK